MLLNFIDEVKRLFIIFDNVVISGEFGKSYLYRGRDERLFSNGLGEWGKRK